MGFQFATSSPKNIVQALDSDFNQNYHFDFKEFKKLLPLFYENKSNLEQVSQQLQKVLINWLALPYIRPNKIPPNQTHSPQLVAPDVFTKSLDDNELIEILKKISGVSEFLRIENNQRVMLNNQFIDSVNEFDECLIYITNKIAQNFFKFSGQYVATYPTKLLLLLMTDLIMVALDGHVKNGFKKAKLSGFSSVLSLNNSKNADMSKICALPFLLSSFKVENQIFIDKCIQESRFEDCIGNHYGRFFDIIFFVQGKYNKNLVTFQFESVNNWYDL